MWLSLVNRPIEIVAEEKIVSELKNSSAVRYVIDIEENGQLQANAHNVACHWQVQGKQGSAKTAEEAVQILSPGSAHHVA